MKKPILLLILYMMGVSVNLHAMQESKAKLLLPTVGLVGSLTCFIYLGAPMLKAAWVKWQLKQELEKLLRQRGRQYYTNNRDTGSVVTVQEEWQNIDKRIKGLPTFSLKRKIGLVLSGIFALKTAHYLLDTMIIIKKTSS